MRRHFNGVGKVAKVFFIGDVEVTDSSTYLKSAVNDYGMALSVFQTGTVIKVYELLKSRDANEKTKEFEVKFIVPYQRNPHFVGRGKLLENLKTSLYSQTTKKFNHRIALYGMGGIGKTQCALEYIYSNQSQYERIYWITAADQASLLSGYQVIASSARLPGLQDASPIEIATSVLAWLRQEDKWLLVVDNLDDVTIVDRLLPENGVQKHTLVTTRNPNTVGIPAEPFEVPLFNVEESVELLTTLSGIEVAPDSSEHKDAVTIVSELQYLPLALEQAAAYIREVTHSFSAYSDDYHIHRQDLHEWVPTGNRQYLYSIATTWSMSLNILQKSDPHAVSFLRLFTYLNPDAILIDFLESGMNALAEDLRAVVSNRPARAKSLKELEKFSLIKWDRQRQVISIHRLVQTVVNDEMSPSERNSTVAMVVHMCSTAFPDGYIESLRVCRRYSDQVVQPLVRITSTQSKELATIKLRVGIFLLNEGKFADSESLLRQAREVYTAILGPDHPDTLVAMRELAFAFRKQMRLAEAIELYEEVLEIAIRVLGEGDVDTVRIMQHLGSTYRQQDQIEKAVELHENAFKVATRVLGDEHFETLNTMHNLAFTYWVQGQIEEAVNLNERVLEKQTQILSDEDPDILSTKHNLATLYREQGRMVEATKLAEEVLEKTKSVLGSEHPDTLSSMQEVAGLCSEQGSMVRATALLEEVLEKRKRVLGDRHHSTLAVMKELASAYRQQGLAVQAAKLSEDVLKK
jgi:tetratricopeptide (TPR) repeat protein